MARFAFFPAKSSGFAIAAAMMAVGTLGATAIATPAYAQKQAKFSKEFLAAFQPIDEAIKGENPDYAALRAQAGALAAACTQPRATGRPVTLRHYSAARPAHVGQAPPHWR